MACALARGFLRAGLTAPEQLLASDVEASARQEFERATGGRTTGSNLEARASAEVLFLAVKPDQVSGVLNELRPVTSDQHLTVSIAAGIRLAQLEAGLADGARVARVMPNTPALVGASASAFTVGRWATRADAALVQRLMGAVGECFEVPEKLLNAVTGLSGSGPAYVYQVIEALSDGGVAAGLPRTMATRLAAQTVLGAARMVLETGLHPGALKDMVTSPGGTTIEGLHELEKAGLRGALISAVRAAADKAARMG
jgi:pyrroline-5-carboxylate reductase